MKSLLSGKLRKIAALALLSTVGGTALLFATCGPFTDVGTLICPFVLELYYQGITAGTSSTTFSPSNTVTRGQMAVFIAAGLDRSLQAGSRRAALDQWWTTNPHYPAALGGLGTTAVGSLPELVKSDGVDVWVANTGDGTVSQFSPSSNGVITTWTGAASPVGVLCAMNRVFITGLTSPGNLYMITPGGAPTANPVATLGNFSYGIAFDGSLIWTANYGGSVSIVTPGLTFPWSVTTLSMGFIQPRGILWDGSNIWVTDNGANTLLKLDASGSVLQTVTVGLSPEIPVFDGRNIWVPNYTDNTVTVVRSADGAVLATLNGNGLNGPQAAAFDGQRILVTNQAGNSVSLWKAANLAPIATYPTGTSTFPYGVCSDGADFWITLNGTGQLAQF